MRRAEFRWKTGGYDDNQVPPDVTYTSTKGKFTMETEEREQTGSCQSASASRPLAAATHLLTAADFQWS